MRKKIRSMNVTLYQAIPGNLLDAVFLEQREEPRNGWTSIEFPAASTVFENRATPLASFTVEYSNRYLKL